MVSSRPPRRTSTMLLFLASLLLLGLGLVTGSARAEKALSGVAVEVEDSSEVFYLTYSSSAYGPAATRDEALPTRLYMIESNKDGCGPASLSPPSSAVETSWTVVLLRGGMCTFKEKVRKAQEGGASMVVVVNTINGLYNSTSSGLLNSCSLNCDRGYSDVSKSVCEENGGCYACAENIKLGSGSFCCVDDSLINMYIGRGVKIPAFFASHEDGERFLIPSAQSQKSCLIYERDTYSIDPSLFIIGFIGCFALTVASYRATSKERASARWIWSTGCEKEQLAQLTELHEDRYTEQVHLSVANAGCFVLSSTCMLVLLFFLVQYYPHTVVRFLQFIFALGAMGALAKLVITPLLRGWFGTWVDRPWKYALSCCLEENGHTTIAKFFGSVIGAVVAFTWLFQRHESWSWILLDILAASLVTSFLLTVRIPSLRVGTALLVAFFVYDIFMVFVTPSIFGGKSVMVDVATAGRAKEQADAQKCYRQREENIPMLFLVPRFDWYGGYALLGLGDIVLPGLLVVLALRFDYAKLKWKHRSFVSGTIPFPKPSFLQVHAYWVPIVISYCLGLMLTFVANIRGWTFNGVKGQPALLYLVPATLGCFFFLLWKRGDYSAIWNDTWLEWEADNAEGHALIDPEGAVDIHDDDEEAQERDSL